MNSLRSSILILIDAFSHPDCRATGRPPPAPFRYRDWGSLAIIGRSAAVANFGWIRLKGLSAWFTWGAVHLTLLMGMRNRAVVYVNWIWSWLTWGRGARLITGPGHPAGSIRRPEG